MVVLNLSRINFFLLFQIFFFFPFVACWPIHRLDRVDIWRTRRSGLFQTNKKDFNLIKTLLLAASNLGCIISFRRKFHLYIYKEGSSWKLKFCHFSSYQFFSNIIERKFEYQVIKNVPLSLRIIYLLWIWLT